MGRVRRIELFVGCLAVVARLVPGAAAVEPAANSAGASPRLKYLPANYWLVGECNVAALMQVLNTPDAQQNPQIAQFKQAMQMVTMMTGIDPERQVSHATFFMAGTSRNDATGMVLIQGSFDNAAVEPRLAGLWGGAPPETQGGRTVYPTTGGGDVLSFPEPSTILFGAAELVRPALDAQDAGGSKLPAELQNVLDRTPADSVVWAAVAPRRILDNADVRLNAVHPELHAQLSKLDAASLYFSLAGDGLLVRTLGYAAQPGAAADLGAYLQSRKIDILHKSGSNVVFTSLLVLSEIAASGEHVEGSLRLTGAAMQELWNTRVIVRPE